MVFEPLFEIIKIKPLNGWFIAISFVIILALMVWVSASDIMHQEIYVGRLVIAGGSSILLPALYSFISTNGWKQIVMYWAAFIFYGFLLSINWHYNTTKIKFIGQGDIDILSAPFSLCLSASFWQSFEYSGAQLGMNISYIWFNFLFYLTLGLVIGVIVFLLWFSIQAIRKRTSFAFLTKDSRIPIVPSLIPVVVMVSYILMLI